MNDIVLENGDSKHLIKTIPDKSIDLLLTDPPYNLAKYSTGNIALKERKQPINNKIADWDSVSFSPEEWTDDFSRVLKPTGNIFIFSALNQVGEWFDALSPKFRLSFLVWHKTNPTPKIRKCGFLNSCELVICCWNKGHTFNFTKQNEMHNFIETPICMGAERLKNPKHPTQKPISVLKKLIQAGSNENDIVLDPFMGVGSTGVACAQLNRRFIGFELKKDYFEASKQRIESIKKGS